jgi:S-adenosylmethionine decarboxylase proenzyme
MAASTKKEPAAASVVPEGACAVDIRIFMLTTTLAMCAAFFAGVSIHLPLDNILMSQQTPLIAIGNVELPTTRNLELSPEDMTAAKSHIPAGQHLLVDMIGIEKEFLDSEERLSDAMVRTVDDAGLSMLSYHCHKLNPAGISCVGVLLESHISFHTWPEEGVITLDLFTCGDNPLLPIVSVIERLFGVGDNVKIKWSHELRGFHNGKDKRNRYLENFSDLVLYILSPLETAVKTHVYSNTTKYQRVDIWDLKEVSFVDVPYGIFVQKLNLFCLHPIDADGGLT